MKCNSLIRLSVFCRLGTFVLKPVVKPILNKNLNVTLIFATTNFLHVSVCEFLNCHGWYISHSLLVGHSISDCLNWIYCFLPVRFVGIRTKPHGFCFKTLHKDLSWNNNFSSVHINNRFFFVECLLFWLI